MKKIAVFLTALSLISATLWGVDKSTLKTINDQFSYALGYQIGKDFKNRGVSLDPALVSSAMKEALDGKPCAFTDSEIQQIMMTVQQQAAEKQGEAAVKLGKAFLDDNAKKKGVKVTASGLQYLELKKGNGKKPSATSTVTVHYRGTLINGTEFDSSYKRNEPATFPLNGVIKGWTEGLQLMSEGGKAQLVIPADLGYGTRGAPPTIGPSEVLVFEIELLSVK
jgi:FKBP-type peptidyl-prolyl cis-trans isomerase FklB